MTLKLIQTDSEFIETAGHKVVLADGREFFYIPFWYEKKSDGLYQQYSFEKLPKEIIDRLLTEREG